MLQIGCHLSVANGYMAIARETISIGGNTFQFFSRNPRGTRIREVDEADIKRFRAYAQEQGISVILAHAPYTLNAAAKDESLRKLAVETVTEDLRRMEYLPGNLYNFHPGSHVKQGAEVGISYICEMLNQVLKSEQTTTVLLETMAGKGSEIGRNFEELRAILDRVEVQDKMGVCLDTCHVWDGGYDIREHLDEVLEEFDQVIGLERLKAVHLNDSMNGLGSHKDRHAKIGEGEIGEEALVAVVNHPKLCRLPFYLETPNDLEGYAREIALLKERYLY
ncbi:MAG: deoxyribonuclease IV [Lachnospiraceae bacterium]|nr:deoxyribonuclease IV [Lachnospiraceae bacterium]